MNTRSGRNKFLLLILAIMVYISFVGFKIYAAQRIPVDFDEPIYLEASKNIGKMIIEGNFSGLTTYDYNIEHPYLGKIIYGIPLALMNYSDPIMFLRMINTYLSSLTVVVLTFMSPLAGILYAGEAYSTKYGLEVYLDGFAALFTMLAIYPLTSTPIDRRKIILSALFTGLAFAVKYITLFATLGVFAYLLTRVFVRAEEKRRQYIIYYSLSKTNAGLLLLWVLIAILSFYIADPSIWMDPLRTPSEWRLLKSLTFHIGYAEKTSVEKPLPPLQQFQWITDMDVLKWHPDAFLLYTGLIILILGFIGLPVTLFRKPVVASSTITYTLFLIIWQVKWPQYTVIWMALLSVSASILVVEATRYMAGFQWRKISLLKESRFLAVLIAVAIIISTLLLVYNSCTGCRGFQVDNGRVVLRTEYYYAVFDIDEGMKITYLEYYPINKVLVHPVKRGDVWNLPYEWIPSNNSQWPGELYYSRYTLLEHNRSMVSAYTVLENDAPRIEVIKTIRIDPSGGEGFQVTYRLVNLGDQPVMIGGSKYGEWGFSIELALSLDEDTPYSYQYYVVDGNMTVLR